MDKRTKKTPTFKLTDYLTFIVSIFFIAYYFLRLFGFFIDAITFVIPMIIAVGYMLITMEWSEKTLTYIVGIVALILGIVCVELFCTNNFTFPAFVSMFVQLSMNMFPLYLVYTILKTKNKQLLLWIVSIFCVVLAYVLILTFIELSRDDRFMREMDINYTNYRLYNTSNAGGFQFAYAVAVLIGFLISLLLLPYKKYSKIKKVGLSVALILAFLLVLNSSYTLALMISLISIIIAVALKIENTTTKVLCILLSILAIFAIIALSDWIIRLMPTEEMRIRLKEVFMFLKSGDASGYNLNGRFMLYGRAILSFFRSPLLGNEKLSFDPHSSILRFFAKDGILGGIGYVMLYVIAYRIITRYFIKEEQKKLFLPTFIALILMGLVNPIHSVGTVHYIAFFIVPLALNLIQTEKKELFNETRLGN